ncbi:hypothetical protein ACQP04_09965 [Pseudonocardia halophobica]|uniref:hypothetical protein n=1 Tax=Pseudonocardia halophobica TaxID=29401 RepID=UPI003D8C327C
MSTGTPGDGALSALDRTSARAGEPASAGAEPSAAAQAADDWLRSAIAELDRVWGKPDALSGALPVDRSGPAGSDSDAVGTSVVLDLVDGDRRIGSPDAERVLRGLTDRMRVHLPSRGRLRSEDPSTLRVDLPGRDRSETAAWLHPVMRDLAASVDGGAELRGARLRGTVHGTDGVTGVQLIQDLEPPPAGRSSSGRTSVAAFRMEDLAIRPGSGGRRHRRAAGSAGAEGTADDEGDPAGSTTAATPAAGSTPPAPAADAGSTGATAVARDDRPAGQDGHRTDGTGDPDATATDSATNADAPSESGDGTGPGGAVAKETPTESLGLGDLLAGAMAAYRGL